MTDSTLHLRRLDGHALRNLPHGQTITVRAHGVQTIEGRFVQVNGPQFDPRTYSVTVQTAQGRTVYDSLGNAFYTSRERPEPRRRARRAVRRLHSMFAPFQFLLKGCLVAVAFMLGLAGIGLLIVAAVINHGR